MTNNEIFYQNVLDWLNMKPRTNEEVAAKVLQLVTATYEYGTNNPDLKMIVPSGTISK